MTALVFRDVKGSDLEVAEADANMHELDRRTTVGWQNLRGQIDITGVDSPPTTSPYLGIPMMSFPHSVLTQCVVRFHMPHDYIEGSDIFPHGHVITPTASAGVVRWGFSMIWANEYDAADRLLGPPAADQLFQSLGDMYVNDTLAPSYKDAALVITPPAALSMPTLKRDAVLIMRVWRDGANVIDTFPDPVFLSFVDLYYQSQGFGSASY